jgi:hypothetical protein
VAGGGPLAGCDDRYKILRFLRDSVARFASGENEAFWPLALKKEHSPRLVVFRGGGSFAAAETANRVFGQESLPSRARFPHSSISDTWGILVNRVVKTARSVRLTGAKHVMRGCLRTRHRAPAPGRSSRRCIGKAKREHDPLRSKRVMLPFLPATQSIEHKIRTVTPALGRGPLLHEDRL